MYHSLLSNRLTALAAAAVFVACVLGANSSLSAMTERLGDVDGFDAFVEAAEAAADRRTHALTPLDDFKSLIGQENTVLLDTRSRDAFERLHIDGAVNVEFADVSAETLLGVGIDSSTRVLIYCNNNFVSDGEPAAISLQSKSTRTALNVPTTVTLRQAGVDKVVELAEAVAFTDSRLPLVGSDAAEVERLRGRIGSEPLLLSGDGDATNPQIDYEGFLQFASELAEEPVADRVPPGAVFLDPRSDAAFASSPTDAVHFNFSDFTAEKLARRFPDKAAPLVVLRGEETDNALAPLALLNLRDYGYTNAVLEPAD